MISKISAVLLAAFLMACIRMPDTQQAARSPLLGVSLTASRSGQEVRLRLVNHSSSALGYNLCASRLLRRTGETWTPVTTQVVCTMELRVLQPDETAEFTHALPPDLPAGEYRYGTSIEMPLGGEFVELFSSSYAYLVVGARAARPWSLDISSNLLRLNSSRCKRHKVRSTRLQPGEGGANRIEPV
jgi:hypothetical protein